MERNEARRLQIYTVSMTKVYSLKNTEGGTEKNRSRAVAVPQRDRKNQKHAKKDESGPSSSNDNQKLSEREQELDTQQRDEIESMSYHSDQTIAVPSKNLEDIS